MTEEEKYDAMYEKIYIVLDYLNEHRTMEGCPIEPYELWDVHLDEIENRIYNCLDSNSELVEIADCTDADIAYFDSEEYKNSAEYEFYLESEELRKKYNFDDACYYSFLNWRETQKLFSVYLEENGLDAYNEKDKSVIEILEQMRILSEKLRGMDVPENIIKLGLISMHDFYRLKVTKDYRILFLDYIGNEKEANIEISNESDNKNNKKKKGGNRQVVRLFNEIPLEPKEKLIYILCLNHPEGVDFKNLNEHYKEEVMVLYNEIELCGNKQAKFLGQLTEGGEKTLYYLLNKKIGDDTFNKLNNKIKKFFNNDEATFKYYSIIAENGRRKILLDKQYIIRWDDKNPIDKKIYDIISRQHYTDWKSISEKYNEEKNKIIKELEERVKNGGENVEKSQKHSK